MKERGAYECIIAFDGDMDRKLRVSIHIGRHNTWCILEESKNNFPKRSFIITIIIILCF